MRITFFLFLFLFAGTASFSQDSISVTGKWKIFALRMGNIFYHNYDKDSTALTDECKLEIKEEGRDSAMTVAMAEVMIEMMADMSYVFQKDGTYESSNKLETENGTYTVDYPNKKIILITSRNSLVVKDVLLFTTQKDILQLRMQMSEDEEAVFELRRSVL